MQRLRQHTPIIALFLFALLIRLVYNLTVAHGYVAEYDAKFFDELAQSLLQNHCYCFTAKNPTTNRAPFWAFVLAAIYFITGHNNFYARIFLCFAGAGSCTLVYLYAQDLFGRRIALLTGGIAAAYTGLFIYDGWLYAESIYTLLFLGFCYSLYRLQRTMQRRWIYASGVLLALTALTRPNGSVLFVLLCIWGFFVARNRVTSWQRVSRSVLAITCIAALVVSPWIWRNYQVSHTFIFVAGGSGVVLTGSYNDTTLQDNPMGRRGTWIPMGEVRPASDVSPHCCEYASEAYNTQHALQWIRTHLTEMPYLLGLHFVNMWVPYTDEKGLPMIEYPQRISSKIVFFLMNTTPFPVYLFALVGICVTWRRWRKELLIPYLMLIENVIQNVAFYGSSRFRAPIEPFLILFVGGAIWWLSSRDAGTLYALRQKSGDRSASKKEILSA